MKSFVKLIFILVFCSKFVVPDPISPDGYRQRADNTNNWPADRNYQNRNTQPRQSLPNNFDSEPLNQQNNFGGRNENERLRNSQPTLYREDALRKETNRNNNLNEGNLEIPQSRPGRNRGIPSENPTSDFYVDNLRNNNNIKSSNINNRPLGSQNNDMFNFEKGTQGKDMFTGNTYNNGKRVNNKQEKFSNLDNKQLMAGRDISNRDYDSNVDDISPSRNIVPNQQASYRQNTPPRLIRNNPLIINDNGEEFFKKQINLPVKNEDNDYDFENGDENEYRINDKSQIPIVHRKKIQYGDNPNARNFNNGEKTFINENNRPQMNTEETFSNNQGIRREVLPNQSKQALPNYKTLNNEHMTFDGPDILNTDDISDFNNNNPSTVNYNRRNLPTSQFEKPETTLIAARRSNNNVRYDNSGSGFPMQPKPSPKLVLPNRENFDSIKRNRKISNTKVFQSEPSDFDLTDEKIKTNPRSSENQGKLQINRLKPEDDYTADEKTLNIPKEKGFIRDEVFPETNSGYTENSRNVQYSTKPSEKRIVTSNPKFEENVYRRSNLDVEEELSDTYDKLQTKQSKRNQPPPIVRESDSEDRIYLNNDNENSKIFGQDQTTFKEDNQKIFNHGNKKKIEIDINYSPPPKYNSQEDDEILDSDVDSTITLGNKPSKLFTTFTQGTYVKQILTKVNIQDHLKVFKTKYLVVYPNGTVEHINEIDSIIAKFPSFILIKSRNIITGQDGIDLKIENDNYQNFEVSPAPSLVKNVNENFGQQYTDGRPINRKDHSHHSGIGVHLMQPDHNLEKNQHIIPIVLNNKKERHTFNLNENIPLTVDFSGPIDEIDINYYIDENITESPIKHNKQDNTPGAASLSDNGSKKQESNINTKQASGDKSFLLSSLESLFGSSSNYESPNTERKKTKERNSKSTSNNIKTKTTDDSYSGISFFDKLFLTDTYEDNTRDNDKTAHSSTNNDAFSNSNNRKVTSNREFKSKTFGQDTVREIQSDSPVKSNLKKTVVHKSNKASVSSDALSDNSSDSKGGITSLFSGLYNWFSNGGSSEDTVYNNDDIPNNHKHRKDKDNTHRVNSHEHNVQSNNHRSDLFTSSPTQVVQQPISNNGRTNENDSLHKSVHSHSKKKKNKHNRSDSNIKQETIRIIEKDEASAHEVSNNQGGTNNGKSHRHHSGFKFEGDEVVTISPIEVPQHSSHGHVSHYETSSPERGPSRAIKNKRKHSEVPSNRDISLAGQGHNDNTDEVWDDYGKGNTRRGRPHKHHPKSNKNNDEIVTLSPIEVPQEPAYNDRLKYENEPVSNGGHLRTKKPKHRNSRSDSYVVQDNDKLSRFNIDQDVWNNQDIDLAKIIANSKPVVWRRGNEDSFSGQDRGKNGPNIMYMFEFKSRPIIVKDTQTTVLSNGTIIKEYTETTYKNEDDTEPVITKSTRRFHPNQSSHLHANAF